MVESSPHGGCSETALEPSHSDSTPGTSACSALLAPESAWHRSPSPVLKKRSESTGLQVMHRKGTLGKGPVLGLVSATVVRPPSPARDPTPTRERCRGSQPIAGLSAPKAGPAAKEQLGQLALQAPGFMVDPAKTPVPTIQPVIGPPPKAVERLRTAGIVPLHCSQDSGTTVSGSGQEAQVSDSMVPTDKTWDRRVATLIPVLMVL